VSCWLILDDVVVYLEADFEGKEEKWKGRLIIAFRTHGETG
jgi:hypothetical protein